MSDATTILIRAVEAHFMNMQNFVVEKIQSRSWASATFLGTRHKLVFQIMGEGADAAADAFLDNLNETEFNLRGHILTDIRLRSQSRIEHPKGVLIRICLEALTMEDS